MSERHFRIGAVSFWFPLLALCFATTTTRPTWAASLDLPFSHYGISLGNSTRFHGIRINFRDQGVERLDGLSLSFWIPRDNEDSVLNGIMLGCMGVEAKTCRGLAVGGLGTEGERLIGLAIGGLGIGFDQLEGVAIGGLGVGGDRVRGIAIGGIGMGADHFVGIGIGGLGVGAEDLTGLCIGGIGVGADRVRGLAAGTLRLDVKELDGIGAALYCHVQNKLRGVSIGLVNRAGHLNGVQIGLLNYARNNPHPFRLLPLLNLHLGR